MVADLMQVDLQISTEPAGASVFLDGADSGKKTPVTFTLPTGKEYLVELRHPDFLWASEKVFAAPGKPIPVKATLKAGGRVEVKSDLAGAQVEIDGKEAFTAPGKSPPMLPGKHFLVARAPEHAADSKTFTIAGTEQVEWPAKLPPATPVQVHSTPSGAQIEVDGKQVGQVTPAQVLVPLGKKHQVRLLLKGFVKAVRALPTLTAKSTALQLEIALEPLLAADLKPQIAALEKKIKLQERKLKKLQSKRSGFMVSNPKKELVLERAIKDAEDELDREQSDLGSLRDEMEKAVR